MVSNEFVDALSSIAYDAFDNEGRLRSYEDQLERYAYGTMRSGDQFVVALDSTKVGLEECDPLPLVMKQSTIRKVTDSHSISLEELKNLPKWLKEHPLALESLTEIDSLVVIADAKDKEENDIAIAIHLEKEARQLKVNDIASVYGKRNLAFLVENTINAGMDVFVNERTSDWLRRTGVPFPERVANRLQELVYQKTNSKLPHMKSNRESPQADIARATRQPKGVDTVARTPQTTKR